MDFLAMVPDGFKAWVVNSGMRLLGALIILIVGFAVIKKLSRILTIFLRQANIDSGLISFLGSIIRFLLRLILIIAALSAAGLNVTSLIAAIGASLVTVGLALKDSLSNFASGVLLIINKPIHVGDYIEFESVKGTVSKIEMMFTTLQSDENKSIIIPNSRLTSNNITRKSLHNICKLELGYELNEYKGQPDIKRIIERTLLSDNKILQVPAPNIKIDKLDDQNILLKIEVWCERCDGKQIESSLGSAIKLAFNKHKIKFSDINIKKGDDHKNSN